LTCLEIGQVSGALKLVNIVLRWSNYQKVFAERKRRVRGLWKHSGWFYAQASVTDGLNGKKSTQGVRL
jgi:hypothetical protein